MHRKEKQTKKERYILIDRIDSSILHKNVLRHFQICAVVAAFLWNSFSNDRCTVLFDCVRTYSNMRNVFCNEVNIIFIPENISA